MWVQRRRMRMMRLSIDSVSGLGLLSAHLQRLLFCSSWQLKLCWKNVSGPRPATDGSRKKNKNVTNVRRKAEKKKTDSFRKVKSSDVFTACKLKPGPGCQRARGWCHRVVLGDKNRNYKCWKSQTGACVASPVTPPLCSTLWGIWLTGSQVWAQTLLSSVGAPRATPPTPHLLAGKDIWMPPPLHFNTLFCLHVACGQAANTELIFVILLLTG